ncbi:MAG TPA: DUF456 family protein [Usitatibacter sp.]|nr:DUF456 family protein [Usitatibacter sp.]
MQPAILYVVAAVLVIAGLVGTVVPALPGVLLVFGGLFLAALADGFARVGFGTLTFIGILAALSFVADFAASVLGAKRVGASPQALLGAAIGGGAGLFFGIPGLLLGPFVGAALGEYAARGRLVQAGKVGLGTWIGLFVAAIAKVVIAFMMVAVFLIAYAWR